MTDDTPPADLDVIDVTVKAGAGSEPLRFSLTSSTTVAQLKLLIEERTSTFARRQKLIFKGKVMEDTARVVPKEGATSVTLMLLATAGGGAAPTATRGAAAVKAAAAAAAEARLAQQRERGNDGGGVRAPPPPTIVVAITWQARRESWGKTGIVAYREAGASEGLSREAAEWAAAAASSTSDPSRHLFANLAPVANPRAMDLSGNPALRRLPRQVFSGAPPVRASLRSLRLASCGLTTEGVPWAWLPPGLTALVLDGNAIDRVPRDLSEEAGEEEEEEEEAQGAEEGDGAEAAPRRRRRPRGKKFAQLALLTLSRNRITHFEAGALAFGGEGGGGGAGALGKEEEQGGGNGSNNAPSSSCLRALDVSHNALAALPWEDMAAGALDSLVELDARGNRVRALEPPPQAETAPPPLNPLARRMPALRSLRLDSNLVRAPLPDSLFGGSDAAACCPSLCVFTLDDNPITAQEMRAAKGWEAFDARRVGMASKRIESGVLLGRGAFAEGADAAEWERYK